MIEKIDFQNNRLVRVLFELQRASYKIEADLIGFDEIPPLKESLDEFCQSGEEFLGYFEKNELAGAISYTIEGEELTICRMVVHPNHFRKGIAQGLLSAVEVNFPEIEVFKVSTGKDNAPARNLYLKNGFASVGDIEVAPSFYITLFEKRRGS